MTWSILAMVLACQDWNKPDPRWETTLALWQDLATIPRGSLDDEEHKMLVRTMAQRTWYSDALPARLQAFIKRAIERRVDTLRDKPGYPKLTSDAWGTIEYEIGEAREVMMLDRRPRYWAGAQQWIAQRLMEGVDWALAGIASLPLDKRLEEMKLSRDDYLTRVQKVSASLTSLVYIGIRILPPVVGVPAEVEWTGGRKTTDMTLGMKEVVVNTSKKPVTLIFYVEAAAEKCPSLTLEPGAILMGFELRMLLLPSAESKMEPLIRALSDSDSQVSAIARRQITAYRVLAIEPLCRAMCGGEARISGAARDLLNQLGGW